MALRAGTSAISSAVATLLAQVASIPILMRVLGMEGFAAFQICLSLAPWFAVAAFGQDRALKNALAVAPPQSRPALKSAVAAYVFPRFLWLAGGTAVLAAVTVPQLGVAGRAFDAPTAALAALLMAVTGYLALVRETLFGEDRGELAGWTQTLAMLLVIAALGALGALPALPTASALLLAVLAWFAPQIAAWMAAARRIALRPFPLSWTGAQPLPGGGGFVAASYLVLVCLNLDVVVLATVASAQEVVHYALVSKVLTVHATFVAAFLAFAWVRWARQTTPWAQRRLQRVAWVSLALAALTLAATATALPSVAAFLGVPDLQLPPALLAALGFALLLRTAGETLSTWFFSQGRTREFAVAAGLQAIVTLSGQILAVRFGLNAAGVLGATAAGWLVLCGVLGVRASMIAPDD